MISSLTPLPSSCRKFTGLSTLHVAVCCCKQRLRLLLWEWHGIKGVQTGYHKIKILNFAADVTIFSGGISCLVRLKQFWNKMMRFSVRNNFFQKARQYGLEHMEIGLIKLGNWYSPIFQWNTRNKFGNSIIDTNGWDKIFVNIQSKIYSYLKQSETAFTREKVNRWPNSPKLWYIDQIHSLHYINLYIICKYIIKYMILAIQNTSKEESSRIYNLLKNE